MSKKVSIMQPYFFPYIGYWQLYYNCDSWVFLSEVQFNSKSWMCRNRVLHQEPDKGIQYINIPVCGHKKGTIISDIRIDNNQAWVEKITGQLGIYKRMRASQYKEVMDLIETILRSESESFLQLILNMFGYINDYLGMETPYCLSTEVEFDRKKIRLPDDWALLISKKLGATEYINPHGGIDIFNENKYLNKGIKLKYLQPLLKEYNQSKRSFQPGLSIIDVLMFNSVSDIHNMIKNNYKYI